MLSGSKMCFFDKKRRRRKSFVGESKHIFCFEMILVVTVHFSCVLKQTLFAKNEPISNLCWCEECVFLPNYKQFA